MVEYTKIPISKPYLWKHIPEVEDIEVGLRIKPEWLKSSLLWSLLSVLRSE